jgi:toluene monooxygenase system protein A
MARMAREKWYDIARDLDWELSYVDYEEVFPEWMSGQGKVPREAWAGWDEPYKVTYPEYVATQREKETGAYSVKAVLQKSRIFDQLDEGWKSVAKEHFGAVALVEDLAAYAELRMARFGLSPAWRNMATFGALDETRHTQISLYFPHALVGKDPQYDWAHKAYHTNQWAVIAARATFDGMMMNPNVVDVAVQLPFTFETGFTNVQFVALAADALESGDINFANMISSIQTDEARHSQQGGPTLEILVEHDPRRAQWIIDKTFWVSARLFAVLTGPGMDYYTPLPMRRQSYSEFMQEWIAGQFVDQLDDYGLKKPWYWDEFMAGLDTWHHSLHLGVWYWRPTVWWKPQGGVSPEERDWLHEKYPHWEEQFGPAWDVIIGNINDDRIELTLPETLPWLCNLCHLPVGSAGSPRNEKYPVRSYPLTYNGYTYHFCSRPCRQIWWEDRDTLYDPTVIERLLGGQIQPPTVEGILTWMGLTPEVRGEDAYGCRWARPYAPRRQPRDRPGRAETGTRDRGGQAAHTPEPAGQGQPVPVNALFEDDFVTQLVVVRDTDTVDQAARKVAAQVVGRRVPPRDAGLVVRLDGMAVPGDITVAESGISALDVVNVGWAGGHR